MIKLRALKTMLIFALVGCITVSLFAETHSYKRGKKFEAALKMFLLAKDSDNPALDYRHSLAAFKNIIDNSSNADEIVRCQYFIALAYFIMRDFQQANNTASKIMDLAVAAYPDDAGIQYKKDVVAAVEDGDTSLNEALIALSANKMKHAAAFGESLESYYKKIMSKTNMKLNNQSMTTIIILALFSSDFCPEGNLAKEKTEQSLCQDNMREIIKGWLLYIKNNRGELPPINIKVNNTGSSCFDRAEWPTIIGKYLPDSDLRKAKYNAPACEVKIMPGSIMQCPAGKPWGKGYVTSYKVNYGMNYMVPKRAKTLKGIENLNKLIVFIDSDNSYAGPSWGYTYIKCRHSGGANVAYADGHVDWKSKAELINDAALPMWTPKISPSSKVRLMVEDQADGSSVNIQSGAGVISKPTYVSKGDKLTAKIKQIPALKGKALVIGDNSTILNQNVAFSINPVNSGAYKIEFEYATLSCSNNSVMVFDLRNSEQKQIFVLAVKNNMRDISVGVNGEMKLFANTFEPNKAAKICLMVDLDNWSYKLLINDVEKANSSLQTVNVHSLATMVFWTPGLSEFAIKNLVADKIKK